MLVILHGLNQVERALQRLADVKEPSRTATHEMEINLNGITLEVLRYLDDPEPRVRQVIDKDYQDFERFHASYLRLAETDRERELGGRMGTLYGEFRTLAQALMDNWDEQETFSEDVAQAFERIDGVIDALQADLNPPTADQLVKLEGLNAVEADIAEVGMWVANYRRTHKERHRELIGENERELRANVARLNGLRLTADERRSVSGIEAELDKAMGRVNRILALEQDTKRGSERLVRLRMEMDDLLDDEMQVLAAEQLSKPRQEADDIATRVMWWTGWSILAFVLSGGGVAAILIRSIRRPLSGLVRGTRAVGQGDLTHRIVPTSRDEFADLADEFNRMVTRLETTTVSKEELEASERKLRDTVDQLCREIADRQRAEEERGRLEASLRRAETLSAMGALVAGVAHQVRNPLFAISSILDAAEARFGAKEEYRPHTRFLRDQVARLSQLMQELLEYGRAPGSDLTPNPLAGVIDEAVRACRPRADHAGVGLDVRRADGTGPVLMDHPRLVRVFENLVENAVQHTPPGGRVTVEVRPVSEGGRDWVECAVADDGPGVREDDLRSLFEPFFTRRQGGTGLGLAIARRIVEEHRGGITAGNRPEGGAVLTLRLPLAAP